MEVCERDNSTNRRGRGRRRKLMKKNKDVVLMMKQNLIELLLLCGIQGM